MAEEVEAGTPLHEAYERQPLAYLSLFGAILRAGAATGDMAGALEETAEFAATQAECRSRLRMALVPPLLTGCFVLVIGLAAWLIAGGNLAQISTDLEVEPSGALAVGKIGLVVLVLFIATVLVVGWIRTPLSTGVDRRALFFRTMRIQFARTTLASTLHLLLRRAVPLPEALDLAATACPGRATSAAVRKMAAAAREGHGLADSVRAGDVFESSLLWLVENAEGSASAADALGDLAVIYRQRLWRAVDRMSVVARPIAELVVGTAVFLFAYSLVVPTFELMKMFAVR
jgi:type II secretory pathway component PulF